MIIEAFVLSVVVGLIRKGRLCNLSRIPLRHFYLFVIAGLLLAGAYFIPRSTDQTLPYSRAVNILQYIALLAAIGVNLRIHGMWLIAVGTFLNFTAIVANFGMMPISEKALRIAGMSRLLEIEQNTRFVRHVIMTPETRLKPLTDVIPVPGFGFIMPQVISVGDVLVAIGVFALVQRYMLCPERWQECE